MIILSALAGAAALGFAWASWTADDDLDRGFRYLMAFIFCAFIFTTTIAP